ncbi:transcriptional regulator [Acidobacteria bacterium AH-259-O06]|nr:transcriptional regulator [Acidobacteria bacterium AH-259-O06]
MAKRSYKQACVLAMALDIVGERWTLLIIRELLIGPRRYNQLLHNLAGMGTNLLATRLREMEEVGLIRRVSREGGIRAYELTERGWALEPTIHALVEWGLGLDLQPPSGALRRREWDVVAIKAILSSNRDKSLSGVFELVLDGTAFTVEMRNGTVHVRMERPKKSDAAVIVDAVTTRALIRGDITPQKARSSGRLRLKGNQILAKRLIGELSIQ